jgi:hypothetical protein
MGIAGRVPDQSNRLWMSRAEKRKVTSAQYMRRGGAPQWGALGFRGSPAPPPRNPRKVNLFQNEFAVAWILTGSH